MNRLRRYLGLPAAERKLFRRALVAVVRVRLGLWLLPFRMVRSWIERPGQPRPAANGKLPPEKIAWAVTAAARYVPRATCLVQALAARRLCTQAGYATSLHFGVRQAGGFSAHAWLECEGRILVGGEEAEEYAELLALGEKQT
jgi:hypothetical protein